MEYRWTFPRALLSFDLFHPNNWNLVSSSLPSSNKDKAKTDEYVVTSNPRLNLKFGEGGQSFDLKWLVSDKGEGAEEWSSVAKGRLDGEGEAGSLRALSSKLSALKAEGGGKGSYAEEALSQAVVALDAPSETIARVLTDKRLLTVDLGAFVAEQIEFDIYLRDTPVPRLSYRSISLEKDVPPEVLASLSNAIKAKHGDEVIEGGFPLLVRHIRQTKLQ